MTQAPSWAGAQDSRVKAPAGNGGDPGAVVAAVAEAAFAAGFFFFHGSAGLRAVARSRGVMCICELCVSNLHFQHHYNVIDIS